MQENMPILAHGGEVGPPINQKMWSHAQMPRSEPITVDCRCPPVHSLFAWILCLSLTVVISVLTASIGILCIIISLFFDPFFEFLLVLIEPIQLIRRSVPTGTMLNSPKV